MFHVITRWSASRLSALMCAAGVLAAGSTATASPIYIDLGQSSGTTAGNWNNYTTDLDFKSSGDVLLENMIDADGDATTVDLVLTTRPSGSSSYGTSGIGNDPTGTASTLPSTASGDLFFFNTNDTVVFTLTGLDAGSLYDVSFYIGLQDNYDRDATVVSIGASSQTVNPTGNEDLTVFSSVLSNASGEIVFNIAEAAGSTDSAYLNAIIVNAVPEPGSLALIALGSICMLRRSR